MAKRAPKKAATTKGEEEPVVTPTPEPSEANISRYDALVERNEALAERIEALEGRYDELSDRINAVGNSINVQPAEGVVRAADSYFSKGEKSK
mgnify:CR=1 FL=1|jgi:hypothetical protein|tara:strand:+ start:734 stop:1012 length:279 start_codon:yes stop_codon:yes gene_type:complete